MYVYNLCITQLNAICLAIHSKQHLMSRMYTAGSKLKNQQNTANNLIMPTSDQIYPNYEHTISLRDIEKNAEQKIKCILSRGNWSATKNDDGAFTLQFAYVIANKRSAELKLEIPSKTSKYNRHTSSRANFPTELRAMQPWRADIRHLHEKLCGLPM